MMGWVSTSHLPGTTHLTWTSRKHQTTISLLGDHVSLDFFELLADNQDHFEFSIDESTVYDLA
jgi:hypothetical protein